MNAVTDPIYLRGLRKRYISNAVITNSHRFTRKSRIMNVFMLRTSLQYQFSTAAKWFWEIDKEVCVVYDGSRLLKV